MAAGGSFLRQEQAFLYKLDQGLTGLGEGLQFQHTTSIKGIDGFECPVYVRHPEDPLLRFRQACLASSNSKEALVVEEGGAPWRVGADQLIDLYRKVHRTQNDLDILGNFKLCSELYNTLHAAATGGPLVSSSAVRTWGVALSTLGSRGEVSATFAIAGRGFFLRSVRGIGGINALYENEARDLIVYELYHACPGLVAREHMRLVNEQGRPQLPPGDYAARIGEAFVRELVKRMAEIREAVKQLSKEQQKQAVPKAAVAAAGVKEQKVEEQKVKQEQDNQALQADTYCDHGQQQEREVPKHTAAAAAAGAALTSPTFGHTSPTFGHTFSHTFSHTSPTFSPSSRRPNYLKRKSSSLRVEQQGPLVDEAPAAKAGRSGAGGEGEGVPLAAAGGIRSHLYSAEVEDLLREGEGDFLAAIIRGSSGSSSRQQSPEELEGLMMEGVPVEDAAALLREEGRALAVAAGAGGEGEGEGGNLAAGAGSPPFTWSLNSSDVAGLPSDIEELEGGGAEQQQVGGGMQQATGAEGEGQLLWQEPQASDGNIQQAALVPIAPLPKAAAGRTHSNNIMLNPLAARASASPHLAPPAAAVAALPAPDAAPAAAVAAGGNNGEGAPGQQAAPQQPNLQLPFSYWPTVGGISYAPIADGRRLAKCCETEDAPLTSNGVRMGQYDQQQQDALAAAIAGGKKALFHHLSRVLGYGLNNARELTKHLKD